MAVTVDGTWQRRGHASKIGVVFVISVRTGEVLDYVVKSLMCHTCMKHKQEDKNTNEYKEWFKKHQDICLVNHKGTSDSMESDGACEIFVRSVEGRSLKYCRFVGDGDTGCFGKVRSRCAEVFGGDYEVVKEECVGHVQKRMGSGLREFKRKNRGMKLSDGKTVGGKGRLTDKIIDKIQNYYGEAIRNNSGNLEGMKASIWAIFKHMIRDEHKTLDEQHSLCPKGTNSWCTYGRDRNTYNDEKRLPSAFVVALTPLFTNLTKHELLERCLQGLTQNQNESINGVLWSKCLKNKFCGKVKVLLAVAETVCHFNSGATSRVSILESAGVKVSANMLQGVRKEDSLRIKVAAKKITEKARMRRRKLRAEKKSKKDDVVTYKAGSFGLSAEPEDITGAVDHVDRNETNNKDKRVNLKDNKATRKRANAMDKIEITFVDESDIDFVTIVAA